MLTVDTLAINDMLALRRVIPLSKTVGLDG